MEDDTTMPQDDQGNCDGTRGIRGLGRSSKKSKQKKVPQRGLGVAQLEKIRLEEQQKRDVAAILPSPNTLSSTTPPYLPLPVKNFHDSNLSHSTPLLPCEPPSEFRSPLSLQQHHRHQQQHMDVKVPSTVPLANSGGFEAGWPVVPGHGNIPKWWSSFQFDSENKNFGVDLGLPIPPSVPFESSPIWPLPNLVQRTPQYQHQHQTSSSMVSVSSGTLSTSMPHFIIEPPSNQNNNCSSVPVKSMEKMVGMKRQTPYPFSLDFPHAPAFNCISSPFAEIGTNGKTPCGNGSGFNFGNSTSREVLSCLASNSEPKSKKRREENENFNGNFLTLAPPSPTSYPPSKSKLSLTIQAFHNQGNVEDQIPAAPPVFRLFNQQKQPFYGFFLPEPKEEQIGETAARIQNGHEVGKSVDLNLKL